MIKRFVDLIAGMVIVLVFSPFLIIIIFINSLLYKGKIFFKQKRIGYKGKSFKLYKFKSMNDDLKSDGSLKDDNERITSFGRFLRESSLDELPSVINLISGDISLVGPRPLPEKYRERFTVKEFKRHDVKPGITGLAQVKGRNAISWKKKFKYDLFYVKKGNIIFDFIILLNTVRVVILKKNINHDIQSTMPEFIGTMSNDDKVRKDI